MTARPRFLILLALALLFLSANTTIVSAQIVEVLNDNWIQWNLPDNSNAASVTIGLKGDPLVWDAKEGYLEFDLTGIVEGSTLVLTMTAFNFNTPNNLQFSLVPVPVVVNALTWNTRPPLGTVLAGVLTDNGLFELTLPASLIIEPQPIVLRVRPMWDGWGNFRSKEYPTDHPYIEATAPLASAPTRDRATLHPCSPNPFNPQTIIRYDLPAETYVELKIFDLTGRVVKTLEPGRTVAAGERSIVWYGRDDRGRRLSSGVYIYRLKAGGETKVRRMTLLK